MTKLIPNLSSRPTSVEQVLSGFKKLVTDLENVADSNQREVLRQTQIIEDANVAKSVANQEVGRALSVVTKLNELLEL